jgi:hypothetical protein
MFIENKTRAGQSPLRLRFLALAIAVLSITLAGSAIATANGGTTAKSSKAKAAKKKKKKKKKQQGRQGIQGPQGVPGTNGTNGTNGTDGNPGPPGPTGEGPNWGTIDRNTIGSANADYRTGPFGSFGTAGQPPFGNGSLNLSVASANDKIAFGNEVDFFNNPVAALTQVGYQVFTTGENSQTPVVPTNGTLNMPSIAFEINPHGAGATTTTFSTMVFTPAANSPADAWSPFIDATTTGLWGLTGSQFNSPATAANCGLNGPRCTFADLKTFLATGTGATIDTAEITKGRDFEWHGAVDGFKINSQVFNFEPSGTETINQP